MDSVPSRDGRRPTWFMGPLEYLYFLIAGLYFIFGVMGAVPLALYLWSLVQVDRDVLEHVPTLISAMWIIGFIPTAYFSVSLATKWMDAIIKHVSSGTPLLWLPQAFVGITMILLGVVAALHWPLFLPIHLVLRRKLSRDVQNASRT